MLVERRSAPPNKRMQLTKLRAAPVLQTEVPPCAPAGRMDGGTASQLIASVLRTIAGRDRAGEDGLSIQRSAAWVTLTRQRASSGAAVRAPRPCWVPTVR